MAPRAIGRRRAAAKSTRDDWDNDQGWKAREHAKVTALDVATARSPPPAQPQAQAQVQLQASYGRSNPSALSTAWRQTIHEYLKQRQDTPATAYDLDARINGGGFSHAPWPSDGDANPTQSPRLPGSGGSGEGQDDTLALLLPLLILLTSLLFALLVFLVFLLLFRRRRGAIALPLGEGGPTNLEHEERWEHEADLERIEAGWLDEVEEPVKIGYMRAKVWQTQYPPNSQPTDITLSQFLSIQEKGVSAWSFEPDYEANPALIVQSRTEITFLADGVGMAPEEGGGCCVQSNLPLPKLNEVYYWECKMFEKPEGTDVAIGLATKPYPSFRMPGWNKYSVGYSSADGFKSHSYPFTSTSYGPPFTEGDVLGVGYRPRSGTVFFTRNGKKLEDAFVGLNRHNLFPTVGADGPCTIHVNLGQAGFVFIEANVKKWGLAPMMGTLAPPPAYGSERGSILLESAAQASRQILGGLRMNAGVSGGGSSRHGGGHRQSRRRAVVEPQSSRMNHPPTAMGAAAALGSPASTTPQRPSPLRHSRQPSNTLTHRSSTQSIDIEGAGRRSSPSSPMHQNGSGGSSSRSPDENRQDDDDEEPQNPPTPGLLDISLHSMHRFPNAAPSVEEEDEEDEDGEGSSTVSSGSVSGSDPEGSGSIIEHDRVRPPPPIELPAHSPPAYHRIDPYMYAPGVAETMLEDAFLNTRNGSSAAMYHPSQHRRPQYVTAASGSVGGYEAGHAARSPSASAGGATTGRGLFGWLGLGSGTRQGGDVDVEAGTSSSAGPSASVYPGGGRRGAPGATR